MLSKNQNKRDGLLFDTKIIPYTAGTARFEKASIHTVEQLIQLNFISPLERQGKSPTTQDFLGIARDLIVLYPSLANQICFQGYVIDKNYEDYRTTLDGFGIECGLQDITPELKNRLKVLFRQADNVEFDNGEFWCWYD